jgi:hypothetical protein
LAISPDFVRLVETLDNRQLSLLRAWLIEERHRLEAVRSAHPANVVAQKEDVSTMQRAMYVGTVLTQRIETPNFVGPNAM